MTQNSTDPHAAHNAAQVGRQVRHLSTGKVGTVEAADYGQGTLTVDGETDHAVRWQDAE